MRTILMIPIYALSSLLSVLFPKSHVYLSSITEAYGAFSLAFCFQLLVGILEASDTRGGNEAFLEGVQPISWFLFGRKLKDPRKWFDVSPASNPIERLLMS